MLRPKRLRDRAEDKCRIAYRRQPDPEHPGAELSYQLSRRLERQSRLPRPTRAGERHESRCLVPNERDNLRHFVLAPHERGERHGEVRIRDRPQRRKTIGTELEQRDRFGEVLQPMLPEVEHVLGDELAGRARQQHLAAVGCAHDPGRLVHVRADVLRRIEQRLARVHADPDPHWPVAKQHHRLRHRRYRTRCRRERIEQAVARVIDLVARVRTESLPHRPPVVGQCLLESLGAELVEQRSRALDVREHQGHRSRRLHSHGGIIRRGQLRHKPTSTCVASPLVTAGGCLNQESCWSHRLARDPQYVNAMSTSARNQPQPASPKSGFNRRDPRPAATRRNRLRRNGKEGSTVRVR